MGLLSRKILGIPLFVGDVLWAVMIYFIFRFIFINMNLKTSCILSIVFCYIVEISQLYQSVWINNIRNTTLGGLILGHGFLWSDIIAYTFGIASVTIMEFLYTSKRRERIT